MASVTDICNRGLQKLGAKRITSLTEASSSARACLSCYDALRQAELRANSWNFAIKRAQLAASATPPLFNRQNYFLLPSDFIRLLDVDPELLTNTFDWQIEGNQICTNDLGPLQIRYIWNVTDPTLMDSIFREALSNRLAFEMCEELTQSNTKKDALNKDYVGILGEARRINAFENIAEVPPEDTWITLRN